MISNNLSYFDIALIILIVGLIYFIFRQHNKYRRKISNIQDQLANTLQSIDLANERLSSVFQISHRLVEADDEAEVVNDLLELAMDVTGAMGVSFVSLDSHSQPQAALRRGEFPFPVPDAWLEYLASPTIRSGCTTCTNHSKIVKNCPLLKGPFSDAIGLYCLPLQRGDREYGVINIYLPDNSKLDGNTRDFLMSLIDATALAVEGVRLRKIEHETINHLRTVQQKADYQIIIQKILENLRQTLQADFGVLFYKGKFKEDQLMTCGEFPVQLTERLKRYAQEFFSENADINEIILPDPTDDIHNAIHIIGLRIMSFESIPLGVFMMGQTGETFEKVNVRALESSASQLGLILQASNDIAEITYKTMMDERVRLSREIHDGLAQTLGFIKLLVAQMQGHIQQGDIERVKNITRSCYQALTDAYIDAREAIDGLRVFPGDKNGYPSTDIDSWLQQTVSEFLENQEIQSIKIGIETEAHNVCIPPEIQAQLIRIVQESLSNVRKHSMADRAEVIFAEKKGDLIMEIRDNGLGFSPEEIPGSSRHGLKGMRERAELIGADFQVISLQGDGTTVRVRIPGPAMEKWKKVNESN